MLAEFDAARQIAMPIWDGLPEGTKDWYEDFFVLPFEEIIDIDENGDDFFDGPHFYVSFRPDGSPPFRDYWPHKLEANGYSRRSPQSDALRVEHFARREGSEDEEE